MSELIDTTEMYLRTLYELHEEGVPPLRARIAERLHQSGPTVSQTVARMQRDGLVTVNPDRILQLTEQGAQAALSVMRKHRLAERLLVDVLGMDWAETHEEACRWEHVMSEAVERRIVALLGSPTVSPYGNPIPGLSDLDASSPSSSDARAGVPVAPSGWPSIGDGHVVALSRCLEDRPRTIRLVAIGEHIQTDVDLMRRFHSLGLLPGAVATAAPDGDETIRVSASGGSITLPVAACGHVFVAPA